MRLALTLVAAVLAAVICATPAGATSRAPERTLAIIGDTPYGDEQEAAFPRLVADIDEDPDVRAVVHLGDIKNGSSTCDDDRLARLRDLYDTFDDPFLYTPGDNEWTDCHRPAAGGYVPTERLARIRELFYPETEVRVRSQRAPFVENQRWSDADVVYALVHVVGSDNGLAPWFGGAETPEQRAERLQEVEAREAAALEWIDRAFDAAEREHARGVVIGMQADTFAGSTAFDRINRRLEDRARKFRRPVLLLQGDTHVYKTDQPLHRAPNLTRIVVEGETASEWLRLTIAPRSREVFSWTREPLPPQLTVATYNIAHAAGIDGRLDLERIAAEIERGGAEIVALQEVDRHWSERSQFVDQAQWLADRLGMQSRLRGQPGPRATRAGPAAPPVRHRHPLRAPDRLEPQHPPATTGERRAARPARGGRRRGRRAAAGGQHPPAAHQRRRTTRADRADRRPARLGEDPDRAHGRPQRPARRAGAGAALAAVRGRVAARRRGRRLLVPVLGAGGADRLRARRPPTCRWSRRARFPPPRPTTCRSRRSWSFRGRSRHARVASTCRPTAAASAS